MMSNDEMEWCQNKNDYTMETPGIRTTTHHSFNIENNNTNNSNNKTIEQCNNNNSDNIDGDIIMNQNEDEHEQSQEEDQDKEFNMMMEQEYINIINLLSENLTLEDNPNQASLTRNIDNLVDNINDLYREMEDEEMGIEYNEDEEINQVITEPITVLNEIKGDSFKNKMDNNIRILYQNINSLRPKNMEKWKAILKQLEDFGVDITCLTETCVNWRLNKLRDKYRQLLRKNFKNSSMSVTTTPQRYEKNYLPGGTSTITTSNISKNISKHIYEKNNMGRWSGTQYQLGNGYYLNVISAYRVCKQTVNTSNSLSTYTQQHFLLKNKGIENPNPREQFIDDIISQFQEECKSVKHMVMFALDANEALGENASGIIRMCSTLGLVDPYLYKHNDFEDFPTHRHVTMHT
jgi:hypothetical protein